MGRKDMEEVKQNGRHDRSVHQGVGRANTYDSHHHHIFRSPVSQHVDWPNNICAFDSVHRSISSDWQKLISTSKISGNLNASTWTFLSTSTTRSHLRRILRLIPYNRGTNRISSSGYVDEAFERISYNFQREAN